MSVPLRRLLHLRQIEEEHQRLALASCLGDLRALQAALAAAREQRRAGKAHLSLALAETDVAGRTGAQVEIEAATRRSAVLVPRVATAEAAAAHAREQFLDKRRERRQVQTLLEESLAREEVESRRRSQQHLDEAFVSGRRSRAAGACNRKN